MNKPRLLVTAVVVGVLAGSAARPARVSAGDAPTKAVTVEAVWEDSCGSLPRCTMRQIIAWRKGNVRFARKGSISLQVRRIVKGRLADPEFLKRPPGVDRLDIIPLDSAAAGVDAHSYGEVQGVWKLTRLPEGSYAALDVNDTPLANERARAEIEATARMAKDLDSGDPQVQYDALRLFVERCCPALIPQVLAMVGSNAHVVAEAGYEDGPEAWGAIYADTTLGREAAAALRRAAHPFSGSRTPSESDSPARWNAWWEEILQIEPFPRVVPDGVRSGEIIALRLNQTCPEMFMSPDASYAVVCATRLEQPLDGMKSGICLIDLSADRKVRWVYRVAEQDINREPRPVRVAWGGDTIGILFKEFDSDEEKCRLALLRIDYSGQERGELREIPLKGTGTLAFAPDAEGWLLAYTTAKGAVFVAKLDQIGDIIGGPVQVAPDFARGRPHFRSAIENLSLTTVDGRTALAYDGEKGLFLALLDGELRVRSTVRVDDPGPPEYCRSQPRIAWNGGRLLVAWLEQGGNVSDRLYMRVFDKSGRPQCDPIEVAEEGRFLAPIAAEDDGFVLAWVDDSITPHQVRVARASDGGSLGPITPLHDGPKPTYPLGVGMKAGVAHVMVYDGSLYPDRYLLKSLPEGTGMAP